MKINLENKYMEIPFQALFEAVFQPGGELCRCEPSARAALILRLENFYKRPGFGVAEKGFLNELEAYLASAAIVSRGLKA